MTSAGFFFRLFKISKINPGQAIFYKKLYFKKVFDCIF